MAIFGTFTRSLFQPWEESASFALDAIASMQQLSLRPPYDFLARSAPLPSNHRLLDQTSIEEFQGLELLRQRVDKLNKQIRRQLERSIYAALALHTLIKYVFTYIGTIL